MSSDVNLLPICLVVLLAGLCLVAYGITLRPSNRWCRSRANGAPAPPAIWTARIRADGYPDGYHRRLALEWCDTPLRQHIRVATPYVQTFPTPCAPEDAPTDPLITVRWRGEA